MEECTFDITGPNHAVHMQNRCITCMIMPKGNGVCDACLIRGSHEGHVIIRSLITHFCDCGPGAHEFCEMLEKPKDPEQKNFTFISSEGAFAEKFSRSTSPSGTTASNLQRVRIIKGRATETIRNRNGTVQHVSSVVTLTHLRSAKRSRFFWHV